jgi:hypothetical protein
MTTGRINQGTRTVCVMPPRGARARRRPRKGRRAPRAHATPSRPSAGSRGNRRRGRCGGRRATAEGRAHVPPTVRGSRPGARAEAWCARMDFIRWYTRGAGRRTVRAREFVKAPSLVVAGEAGTRREVRRPGASPLRRPPGAALWPAAAGLFGLRELVPCGTAAGVVIDERVRVNTRLGVVCTVCRSECEMGRNAEDRRPRCARRPARVVRGVVVVATVLPR